MKAANTAFGLEGGDLLIKMAADAIRSAVRATDVVARNSGGADEFFVMLPETDIDGAEVVAENIRDGIASVAISRDAGVMRSTASIGVVAFPGDGKSWADLKNRADQAEREAKRRGGDQVVRYDRDVTPPAGSTHSERRRSAPRIEQGERWAESVRETQRVPAGVPETRAPVAVGAAPAQARPASVPEATRGPAPWETR
jgi:diguanylate cyclase (GGDEF)-like protein